MYGINVVNFSPFLSYALFGGAVAAITVTKHGTISADFWVEGFFVEKSLTGGLSNHLLLVGQIALLLFVAFSSSFGLFIVDVGQLINDNIALFPT